MLKDSAHDRVAVVSDIILEIHVPLSASPQDDQEDLSWIDTVDDHLASLAGPAEALDDSEEWHTEEGQPEYLFFLSNASEQDLISVARDVSHLPGVPSGVYVTLNTPDGEMGEGRRLDLATS